MFTSNVRAACPAGVDSCGSCGEGCTWEKVGTDLSITGTGDHVTMNDYNKTNNKAPWGNDISSVNFTGNIDHIGEYAFYYANLTEVTIPETVTSIGWGSFSGNKLTAIDIPDSVTSIGTGAFHSNNLQSIVIPDSITTIDRSAFYNNPNLSSVVIGNGLSEIGDTIFYADTKIQSIVIGDNVSSIAANALSLALPNAKVYCHNTETNRCSDLMDNGYSSQLSKLVLFEKNGDLYKITDEQGNFSYYESANNMAQGVPDSYGIKNDDGSYTIYDTNGTIKGFEGKRVYTPAEASLLVKPTGNKITLWFK